MFCDLFYQKIKFDRRHTLRSLHLYVNLLQITEQSQWSGEIRQIDSISSLLSNLSLVCLW